MIARPKPKPAIELRRRLVYAIDPGTTSSGWCVFDANDQRVCDSGELPNVEILDELEALALIWKPTAATVAIEGMANMGMEIGQSTLDAAVWIGRFIERAGGLIGEACSPAGRAVLVYRRDVKLTICGSSRAKDKNVRQAMIDAFGGDDVAIGGKKCKTCKGKGWAGRGRLPCRTCKGAKWEHRPGPLHGVAGHAWSALAVALTYTRTGTPFGRVADVR